MSEDMTADITVSPFYHSAVNEITKPSSLVFMSHYFARKWAPDLGALGVAIVLCLRDRCYYDRRSGEKRDLVEKFPVREIAKACSVSEKTIRREFDRNVPLKKFVAEEYEYKAGRIPGSVLEDAYSYRIAMDDPIHPSDEQRLLTLVRARAEALEKGVSTNTRQAAKERAKQSSTPGQIDQAWSNSPGGLDKLTGGLVNLSRGVGQNDQALTESFCIPKNPLESSSEVLPSAVSREEPKEPEKEAPAAPWPFDLLPEAERSPWLDKAEAELREGFGAPLWAKTKERARAPLRERRAVSLYLAAKGGGKKDSD